MIVTEFYKGQGLGNQLWVYSVARILAEKRQCSFSILGRERFKGLDFIDLDFGEILTGGSSPEGGPPFTLPEGIKHYYRERKEVLRGTTSDISRTDPGLLSIGTETKFDGVCQSTEYLKGYDEHIRTWIKIAPDERQAVLGPNSCILHIRCGDFMKTDAFMHADYYEKAMAYMKRIDPDISFYCVTDQKSVVEKMLPGIPVIGSVEGQDNRKARHHYGGPVGTDFRLLLQAPYLIIPPSSFSWWAAYLNTNKKIVIAPKYWARYNTSDGFWSTYDMVTPTFSYMDKAGVVYTAEACEEEKKIFEQSHQEAFNADIPENTMLTPRSRIVVSSIFFAKRILKKFGLLERIKRLWYHLRSTTQTSLSAEENQAIQTYRKRIKIFDCFLFFNELELLEMRLTLLDPYVDYFVIVEATKKFSGGDKPLYYEENKDRFKKWSHKIIHYVITDTPESDTDTTCDQDVLALAQKSPNVPKGQTHWLREFYQKEMIKKALLGKAADSDICFISDVDEFWNPRISIDYRKNVVYKMRQTMYAYFINNRSSESWTGTYATQYKTIKTASINHLDTPSRTHYSYINQGGWHFTNLGGADRLIEKIESYGHQEFNTDNVKSQIANHIEQNTDFIGRNYSFWIDESALPEEILLFKERYPKLFK